MTIKEINQKISFYENSLFGLKIMLNSTYTANYSELLQRSDEIKKEIYKLKKELSLKIERKEKLKKLKNEN